ncbi:hypothetical protein POTOM_020660 [Populus tomentosa]|uniref:Uncharacterized protein n=1 Tax=Populus tomentosa TaxID=118781 RepID=A0A8X7ZPS8_POPTO|nr:hypothetical protein POTOM_020660 [Populus tomentosa]
MILEFMLCLQREKKGEVKDSKQGSQFTTGVLFLLGALCGSPVSGCPLLIFFLLLLLLFGFLRPKMVLCFVVNSRFVEHCAVSCLHLRCLSKGLREGFLSLSLSLFSHALLLCFWFCVGFPRCCYWLVPWFVTWEVSPRLTKDRERFPTNNILFMLFGAGLLWMSWTCFNGGDPCVVSTDASLAVLNTVDFECFHYELKQCFALTIHRKISECLNAYIRMQILLQRL